MADSSSEAGTLEEQKKESFEESEYVELLQILADAAIGRNELEILR